LPARPRRFVHGEEGLQQALRTTEALRPGSATQLDATILEEIAGDAPSASLPAADVAAGKQLADVAVAAKLLPSKGEYKRMVKNGGVYLNNAKVTDPSYALQDGDLIEGRLMLLAAGKKNKMLVRVQQQQ
jgi:tyrosyl-tRNA synthetase